MTKSSFSFLIFFIFDYGAQGDAVEKALESDNGASCQPNVALGQVTDFRNAASVTTRYWWEFCAAQAVVVRLHGAVTMPSYYRVDDGLVASTYGFQGDKLSADVVQSHDLLDIY
jgi:hypothetical protein